MKLLLPLLGVLSLSVMTTAPLASVYAEQSNAAAAATAHALDELANCRAQRRPECPTDAPTLTPSPTSTATPLATAAPSPIDDATATPTATPGPCWLTDQVWGDPDNGYVVFVAAEDPDAPYAPIQIPCDATPTPTPSPTDMPTPTATPQPSPPLAPPIAPARPTRVRVQTVMQTVVVRETVVVVVSATPVPRPATPTPRPPTPASSPTATSTPTVTASATAPAPAFAAVLPTQAPRPTFAFPTAGVWDWGAFLRGLGVAVVLLAGLVWLLTRRRVAVWRSR